MKLSNQEEILEFGRKLGREAQPDDIFCLFGPLGVGKTTLVKGIAEGSIGIDCALVNSPTFPILNIYEGLLEKRLYHFDLYRLDNEEAFLRLGFEEFLFGGELCCIEWSEKIAPLLSQFTTKKVTLQFYGNNERLITLST